MSLKHALLVPGAALALIGSAADASAQFYDRQRFERQRTYQSHARPSSQVRPAAAASGSYPSPSNSGRARPVASVGKPTAIAARGFVQEPAKPVSAPRPLTEAELAAKAEADEILSREPALAAAKDKPDPKLARAAAARHDAEVQRLAVLKAKDEAEAARRREAAEKAKAREDAKAAAQQSRPDKHAKSAPGLAPTTKPEAKKQEAAKQVAAAVPAPAALPATQPVLRMPTP